MSKGINLIYTPAFHVFHFSSHGQMIYPLPSKTFRLENGGPGLASLALCFIWNTPLGPTGTPTPTTAWAAVLGATYAIMALLDVDGDGKLTWEDQKLLFKPVNCVSSAGVRRGWSFPKCCRSSLPAKDNWNGDWQERPPGQEAEAREEQRKLRLSR